MSTNDVLFSLNAGKASSALGVAVRPKTGRTDHRLKKYLHVMVSLHLATWNRIEICLLNRSKNKLL